MWCFFFKVHLVFFKLVFNPSKTKFVECGNAIDERRTFLHNFIMQLVLPVLAMCVNHSQGLVSVNAVTIRRVFFSK